MEGIEALMSHVYVFPLVGLVLGAILGGIAFLGDLVFPSSLVALLVTVAIYKLCGINHIDGLADFADGVIAHGSREKKIQAMKDVALGTGGGVFIALMLIALYAAISSSPSWLLPLFLVAAEVSAKQSMICFAAFSRSLQKGFGQIMIERTGRREFLMGIAISAALCILVLGPLGLAVLLCAQLAALYMVRVANRNFGGSTGDGIGAANEICRAVSLAAALTLWEVLPWTLW